ncbi:MAG: TRAP transporter large permease [Paracraurococcus sp.]
MPEEMLVGLGGFAALLGLIALRCPVGLAMLLVGAGGYVWIVDLATLMNYLKTTPWHLFASYTLSVVPLFILMGALAERGGLARELFVAANAMVGHKPGGLAQGAMMGCTVFGAICGSSVATTATMGRACLPELRRHGYQPGISAALLAVGGTLGVLIPPSVILVIYAISTEQNIVKLFMASTIPGFIAAGFYMAVIWWLARRDPANWPAVAKLPWRARLAALRGVWGITSITVIVVAGLFAGIFTPTESAAVGCILTLALGVARRDIGWREVAEALRGTAETTAMIFVILLGAEVFNAFLALSQLPDTAAIWVSESGLPPYGVLVLLLVFYIILGAVMDELAMILLTLPVFFPVVTALDFGMTTEQTALWFGVLVLGVVGIGLTAPPIGLNVFVIASMAKDVPIARIYRGVLPFLLTDLVRLALCVAFPGLSLWLVQVLS